MGWEDRQHCSAESTGDWPASATDRLRDAGHIPNLSGYQCPHRSLPRTRGEGTVGEWVGLH